MNTNQLEIKLLSIVKDFDYLACDGSRLISKSIKTITGGKFSHSAHIRIKQGKLFVVDAQKDGYSAKTFSDWYNQYKYDFHVLTPCVPFDEEKIKELDLIEFTLLGKEYDFESLLIKHPRKIILEKLSYITGKQYDTWKAESFEDSMKSLYCSEAEAVIYSRENVQVNPTELYQDLVTKDFRVSYTHKK